MSQHAFTFVSSRERLNEFKVAYKSLREHHPFTKVYLVFTDDPTQATFPEGVDVLPYGKSIDCLARLYGINEALKRGHTKVIALDSDVYVYSSLNYVFMLLDRYNAVVTPHNSSPLPDDGLFPNQQTIALAGNYNAGFFACRASDPTRAWMKWWTEQTIKHPNNYNEQHWLRFIGDFLEDTYVLRSSGYNAAYRNVMQRDLRRVKDKWITKDGPLVFYHFSGLDPANPEKLSKHQGRYTAEGDLLELYKEYIENLNEKG